METSSFPIERLDDDVLHVVFQQLNNMSRDSMRCCSAVCHRFYRIGAPIVNQYLLLYNAKNYGKTIRRGRVDSAFPRMTKTVYFQDRNAYGSDDAEPLIDFVRAAAGSTNLRIITMDGSYQVSQKLMDAINKMLPHVRLHLNASFPNEEDDYYEGWGLAGPLGGGMNGFSSPQLHTLKVDSSWRVDSQGKEVVTRSLSKIIQTCLNLRAFTTYRPCRKQSWRGVVQELHLDLDYDKQLPELEQFWFVPLAFDTLRTWIAVDGWVTLRVLKIRPEYLEVFTAGNLVSLKHLTVAVEDGDVFLGAELDRVESPPTAPLESIFITFLSDSHIPHKFLTHYASTLRELSVHPTGMGPPDPFSTSDVAQLNITCPDLERLCIRLVMDGSWPYDLIAKFSEFKRLVELFLDCGYRGEINPKPDTSIICHKLYNVIQKTKKGSILEVLGLHCGNDWVSCGEDWEDMRQRIRILGTRSSLGNLCVQELGRWYACNDYSIDSFRMSYKLRPEVLKERPFSQAYNAPMAKDEIFFFAKKLGPTGGSDWAEEVLLPQGLITREILNAELWGNGNVKQKCDTASEEERQRMREWMTDELRYWKKRREIAERHGEFFFLWDIMYPQTEGAQPQLLNDIWK